MEVKGDFQESLEELGVHAGTCAEGAEGVQRRSARRTASARATSLRMTATRASLGSLRRPEEVALRGCLTPMHTESRPACVTVKR